MNPARQETSLSHQRLRVTYTRSAALRFISHQDEFRMWERTIRRTRLPLAYKQGFNPQPYMQFAAPLGVGFSGSRELMDFRLAVHMDRELVRDRLRTALPPGVTVCGLQAIPLKEPALPSLLLGADYALRVQVPGLPDGHTRVQHFLHRTEIWRQRQRKGQAYHYNLRPLVHALVYTGLDSEGWHAFHLRVQMLEGATGRPDEVLDVLGLADFPHVLHREHLYFTSRPDDQAVFAPYTLATQEQVTCASADGSRRARRKAGRRARASGTAPPNGTAGPQTFSDKAADEFR